MAEWPLFRVFPAGAPNKAVERFSTSAEAATAVFDDPTALSAVLGSDGSQWAVARSVDLAHGLVRALDERENIVDAEYAAGA